MGCGSLDFSGRHEFLQQLSTECWSPTTAVVNIEKDAGMNERFH
jgi:hypothetical protein